jgi:hypothetical protein
MKSSSSGFGGLDDTDLVYGSPSTAKVKVRALKLLKDMAK